MTETTNLGLNIIEDTDLIDYAPFNENAQIIDGAINTLNTSVESIPTLETAVGNNTNDITSLQGSVSGLSSRMSSAETDIADIQTVNTSQGAKITALENNAEKLIINGVETAIKEHRKYVFTDVEIKQNSYYGYSYSEIKIPLASLGTINGYKVTSAQAYNGGLTFAPTTTGAVAGSVRTLDNNIVISFVNTNSIAPDNLTVAIELMTY